MAEAEGPDITPYVPLAPYGRTASEVAVAALQDLATKLPGVTLREGYIEVALVETLCTVVAELGLAVDRVPGVVAEVIIRLHDVERNLGSRAAVDLEITLVDTAGHTVPAGTEVAVELGAGLSPAVFATDEELVVPAASSSGVVSATALVIGAAPNGIAAGTTARLRSSVSFVASVTTDTAVAGGADPETDEAYFTRAVQRFARLTEVLVKPEHFKAAALEHPAVTTAGRVHVIPLYDGVGGPPYSDTGHVTIVARGPSGNLSAPDKTDLEETLADAAPVNVEVHVIDATETPIDVAAQVVPAAGVTDAAAIAAATDALAAHLDAEVWPFHGVVRFFEIVHLIEDLPEIDHIVAGTLLVEGGTADVALAGDGPLATAGTIAITT